MAANDNRFRPFSRRLLAGVLGLCVLLALALFAGSRSGAQSAPAQQSPQAQSSTQQTTPVPAQPATDPQSTPGPVQQDTTVAPAQPADQPSTDAAPAPPRPPYPGMTPEEQRKQQVSRECADLLKLATDLKAQVDKARKDELSITVVRKATELEQMAHKIKSGTALTASNR